LKEKWEIRESPGITAEVKNGVLEINFHDVKQFNYYHSIKHAQVEPHTYYKLSGYIKTENLTDARGGVCLEAQDGRGWLQTHFAAATCKISGTTDWKYVEIIFETLSDAKSVIVIARRRGEEGPLKGKACFKDVRLEKYILSEERYIPYLSVNASKSREGNKFYLMVINKNMDESIPATIDLKEFLASQKGEAWILNGPSIDAINETNHMNVRVKHSTFTVMNSESENGSRFRFTFEPHSLTAIRIGRNRD
jgi:hypothetical protein